MVSKKVLNTLLVSAVALTVMNSGAARAEDTAHAPGADKEKCYGVAKTAKNDCASASGSHSCAGQAAVDGSTDEWVAVPVGTCDKLVNGSLTGGAAAPAEAAPAEGAAE